VNLLQRPLTRNDWLFLLFLIVWIPLTLFLLGNWAFGILPVSMLGNYGTTDLELINRYCPCRLIQPEWLGNDFGELELLLQWSLVENFARLAALLIVAALLAYLTLGLWKRLAVHTSRNKAFGL